jgi:hypothetical protein
MSNTRKLAANYQQNAKQNNYTHNLIKFQLEQLNIIGSMFNTADVNETNIKDTCVSK